MMKMIPHHPSFMLPLSNIADSLHWLSWLEGVVVPTFSSDGIDLDSWVVLM